VGQEEWGRAQACREHGLKLARWVIVGRPTEARGATAHITFTKCYKKLNKAGRTLNFCSTVSCTMKCLTQP
jgi:hypothetical protein